MAADLVASLLSSGHYSDFAIECQGHSFKVHKAIVCSQSPVIDAALRGEFKEAATNVVKISGFDVETVQRMLNHMYGVEDKFSASAAARPSARTDAPQPAPGSGNTPDHPEQTKPPSEKTSPGPHEQQKKDLASHVWTNAIADYYQVPSLCKIVKKMIVQSLKDDWNTETFLEVASLASSSTGDKSLHRSLTQLAVDHIEELGGYDRNMLAGLVALNNFSMELIDLIADRVVDLTGLINTHSALVETTVAENNTLIEDNKNLRDIMNQSSINTLIAELQWFKSEYHRLKPENDKFRTEIEECKKIFPRGMASYSGIPIHS